jgi:hypothetical protein
VNPKLFGAIVLVGAAVGASASCRTGMLAVGESSSDLANGIKPVDLAQPPAIDFAQPPVDLAQGDAPICSCGSLGDMSGCIVIPCILIL